MKIYTRTGDAGQTSLYSGRRLSKADPRVEAYGTIDELNACIGLLRDHLGETRVADRELREELLGQQQYLFALGAALADDRKGEAYKVPEHAASELEDHMDRMDKTLPKMTHFILPGGSPVVSFCHLARTVCRRAERRAVEVPGVDPAVVVYLNRLSDYLFVVSRYVGKLSGVAEIKWQS